MSIRPFVSSLFLDLQDQPGFSQILTGDDQSDPHCLIPPLSDYWSESIILTDLIPERPYEIEVHSIYRLVTSEAPLPLSDSTSGWVLGRELADITTLSDVHSVESNVFLTLSFTTCSSSQHGVHEDNMPCVTCIQDSWCNGNEECSENHDGLLCLKCADGYFKDGAKCLQCSRAWYIGILFVLIIVAFGLVVRKFIARSIMLLVLIKLCSNMAQLVVIATFGQLGANTASGAKSSWYSDIVSPLRTAYDFLNANLHYECFVGSMRSWVTQYALFIIELPAAFAGMYCCCYQLVISLPSIVVLIIVGFLRCIAAKYHRLYALLIIELPATSGGRHDVALMLRFAVPLFLSNNSVCPICY